MSANGRGRIGPLEWRISLLAFGSAACLSIDFGPDPSEVERSPARAIEQFCDKARYELEGSAKRTEGITGGSCAFLVGPTGGSVRFIVTEAVASPYARYWFEVLLTDDDGTNGRWKTVAGESDSVGQTYSVFAKTGVTTRIIDVRLYAERTDPTEGSGCSVRRRSR
jgi:hypothetical protein